MKKIILIVFIAFIIVMCIPATEYYDDGGTIKYNAVLWSVTKHNSIARNLDGYNTGTTVRIFWFDVYENLEFTPNQKGA